jgi:hypothetical protein
MQRKESLGETAGFFTFLGFFGETQDFIHNLNVGEQHTTATETFHTQRVQDILRVLASADSAGEFFPLVADEFAASETSYRDNHLGSVSPVYL